MLDVAFKEDARRVRCGHGAENPRILRRTALILIRQGKGIERSKRIRPTGVAWDCGNLRVLLGLRAL